MHPNTQQQQAIQTHKTAVVSAGAGSGKTAVLTRRYLRLIREGRGRVDSILTLTFTRKAAAEMRERIQRALTEAGTDSNLTAEQRMRIQEANAGFARAAITTLDSFCSQVVREAARDFGISPEFTTDEQRVHELLRQECLGFLADRREEPGMQAWLRDFGVEAVLEKGLVPLAREEFSLADPRDWSGYTGELIAGIQQQVDAVLQSAAELQGIVEAGRHLQQPWIQGLIAAFEQTGADFGDTTAAGIQRLRWLSAAAGEIKLNRGSKGSGEVQEYTAAAKQLVKLLREELPPALTAITTQPYVRNLGELCGELQDRVLERKRSAGVLGFSDVAQLALRALLRHPELRRYHTERITHIMIDEFQDNNQLQQDLLFALSLPPESPAIREVSPTLPEITPDRLFFVGDEKQSIFRFRGADVAIFRRLAEYVPDFDGEVINLGINYRSEPRIIAFFNSLFGRVFGTAREEYEARFEQLEARDPGEEMDPQIELWLHTRDSRGDDEESGGMLNTAQREAEYMARWLKEQIGGEQLRVPAGDGGGGVAEAGASGDGGGGVADASATEAADTDHTGDGAAATRPAEYRDCAILFRSGSSVMYFEEALRRHGIPYTSLIMRSLFLEAPANDIYAALQTAVYPEDRTAYAALLRSPLVGIGDDLLAELLLTPGLEVFPEDDVLANFEVSAADGERMRQGREMYAYLRSRIDRDSPAELLDYLWYDCGYRWFLLRRAENHPYLEHFEYLREWFSQPGRRLLELLQELRSRLGENTQYEGEDVVREQQNAVSILTVHASKGLGFPVVLAARAGQSPRAGGGAPLGYLDGKPVFMLSDPEQALQDKRNLIVERAKEAEAQRQEAELKRLLYVALTRVKHHLIVSGIEISKTPEKKSGDIAPARTFGVLLRRALGLTRDTVESVPVGDDAIAVRWIDTYSREEIWGEQQPLPARNLEAAVAHLTEQRAPSPRAYAGTLSVSDIVRLLHSGEAETALFADGQQLSRIGAVAVSGDAAGAAGAGDPVWLGTDPAGELPALAVDPLIGRHAWEDRFGSLCHFVLEQRLVRPDAPISADEIAAQASGRFQSRLPDVDWQRLFSAAWQLSEDWLSSGEAAGLGIQPGRALSRGAFGSDSWPELQAEREFLLSLDLDGREQVVRGIMDVTVEYADRAVVLDYKTDRHWDPQYHRVQLSLYRQAMAGICGKPVDAGLLPLRSGRLFWLGQDLPRE